MPSSRTLRTLAALALALLALGVGTFGALPTARASTPAVTGTIDGPSVVGTALHANYTVTATGGPAEAPNGTTVGSYSFTANLTGANTTGASLTPASGVLTNGSASLAFVAPPNAERLTISVVVTSHGTTGLNRSNTLTYSVDVVEPFTLNATLQAAAGATVGPFPVTIDLDGSPVGVVTVPTMTGGSSYTIVFPYVDVGLAPGWHTFSLSLAGQNGLVHFAGGAESFQASFYVTGPAPDYTLDYVAGLAAFVLVVFIWTTRVASRRAGRAKK